jgi:hypothetical protein
MKSWVAGLGVAVFQCNKTDRPASDLQLNRQFSNERMPDRKLQPELGARPRFNESV